MASDSKTAALSKFDDRARAEWTRVECATTSLDLLVIHAAASKSWRFVWTGRVVVQALSEGVSWTHSDQRNDPLPTGGVLVAGALDAQLRLTATRGASFRVLFERLHGDQPPSRAREHRPHAGASLDVASPPAALFHSAIALTTGDTSCAGRLFGPVARAREYIQRNVDEDFDLQTLSAAVGVERCHLCRAFERTIGLPPYRFRSHLRVARARALLAAGRDCSHVAHAVGFCDQSHLIRCFKELTGTTPGAYARACRTASAEWHASSAA